MIHWEKTRDYILKSYIGRIHGGRGVHFASAVIRRLRV